MITSNDLKGIMTMMPAFTKKDGDRIEATDTVDTDELSRTVDKIISDGGCNLLTTTGSFGRVSHIALGRAQEADRSYGGGEQETRAVIYRLYESESTRGDSSGKVRPGRRR